jgi:hypothetical protein
LETQIGNLKPAAYQLIRQILLYNYVVKNPSSIQKLQKLYMLIEFRYITRKFKLLRFNEKKFEIDIEGIIGGMGITLDRGILPLHNQTNELAAKINKVRLYYFYFK